MIWRRRTCSICLRSRVVVALTNSASCPRWSCQSQLITHAQSQFDRSVSDIFISHAGTNNLTSESGGVAEAENVRDKFSKYIQVLQSKTQIEVIISCSSDAGSNFLKDYSSQQWLQWSNTCNTSPLTVDDCYVSFPPNLYKSSIKSISEWRNALYKQYTPRWQLCSCKLWWLLGLIPTKSI